MAHEDIPEKLRFQAFVILVTGRLGTRSADEVKLKATGPNRLTRNVEPVVTGLKFRLYCS